MKAWFRRHSIIITLLPVITIMVTIFCLSAQTKDQSAAMSGQITNHVTNLLAQNSNGNALSLQIIGRDTLDIMIRKFAHFSEYALLGFFLMLHLRQVQKRLAFSRPHIWAWGIGTLYAISDELHQGFVDGRSAELPDVLLDSGGVLAGIMLCLLAFALVRRKRRQSNPA